MKRRNPTRGKWSPTRKGWSPVCGRCFKNSTTEAWDLMEAGEKPMVVHGKVTNVEGKTFDHAWIELDHYVIDPTSKTIMPEGEYYEVMSAVAESRYTAEEAMVNSVRAGHQGPWTSADLRKA